MQGTGLEFGVGDGSSITVKEESGRFYRMGFSEAAYLQAYYKEKGLDLSDRILSGCGENVYRSIINSEKPKEQTCRQLEEIFCSWLNVPEQERKKEKRGIKVHSISRIRLLAFDPSAFLEKIPFSICAFFSSRAAGAVFAAGLLLILIARSYSPVILSDILRFRIDIEEGAWLILLSLFSMCFHELAHALCCRYYGGRVNQMGIVLFFFIPCPFCNVSDIYLFDRRKRLWVSMAGTAANMMLGDMAMAAYLLSLAGERHFTVLLYFWAVNLITVVFNLLPLVKLDGYWMLSAITGKVNLMDRALKAALEVFRKRNTETEKSEKGVLISLYGWAVILFRPLFWGLSVYSICRLLDFQGFVSLKLITAAILVPAAVTDEIFFVRKLLKRGRKT